MILRHYNIRDNRTVGYMVDDGVGEPYGTTWRQDMLLERGGTGRTRAERFAYYAAGWSGYYRATEVVEDGDSAMAEYGLHELAKAMVEAKKASNAAPGRRDYHAGNVHALLQALRANEREGNRAGSFGLQHLLDTTVTLLAGSWSPFDGILEAPSDVAEMFQRHGVAISNAGARLEGALLALLVDLVVLAYAIPPDLTVTDEERRHHGYNPAPLRPDQQELW